MGREFVEQDTEKNARRGCRVPGVPGVTQLCGLQTNQGSGCCWPLLHPANETSPERLPGTEGHFTTIKGSIHQGLIMASALTNTASTYMESKLAASL